MQCFAVQRIMMPFSFFSNIYKTTFNENFHMMRQCRLCNLKSFQKFIPWIALILLLFIGGKMLIEGIQNLKKDPEERNPHILKIKELVFQGVATAIDALSVGFTIANYNLLKAFIASVIIGVVTMVLCLIGVSIGRKVGTKIGDKATIIGGIILIAIGIEIFVTGVF